MKSEDVRIGMKVRGVKCADNFTNEITVDEIYKVTKKEGGVFALEDREGNTRSVFPMRFEPPKFKIGDSVRCIDTVGQGQLNVGEMYEITGLQEKGENVFVNGNTNGGAGFFTRRFELAEKREFQKGDRVRILESVGSLLKVGSTYKIDDIISGLIRIDGWYFHPSRLEHVDAEPSGTLSIQDAQSIGYDTIRECVDAIKKQGLDKYSIAALEHINASSVPNHIAVDWSDYGVTILKRGNGRFKEVKDMEEETLKEICKQLKIEVVGEEDGSSYILKDGRIGVIMLRTVKIPLTQAEQRKLVSKLPKPINTRAFILKDRELSFNSHEFVENKKE